MLQFLQVKSSVAARVVTLLLAVVAPRPAAAQAESPARADTLTLTLDDVQRLVVQGSPTLLSTRQETAVARGALRQARLFRSNPDLAVQATGGVRGSARGQLQLTLAQEIEWAGQRGLRASAAQAGLERAVFGVRDAGRLTISDASVSFHRAFAAERRLAVAEEALSLVERLLSAVRVQVREGEISTLEANLAEIEAGRARGRVLSARRAATGAELELKLQLGLAPEAPVRLIGDSTVVRSTRFGKTDVDSLVALAVARRPDLASSDEAVREAETLRALSRREAFPNLRVGAAATSAPGDARLDFGPAVGLTLPFFNRNQGVADQRRAQLDQAQLDRRATLLRVRADVATADRAFRAATEEALVYETTVLQLAHENVALLEIAYGAGKIGLSNLLLLRNQLLDAELGFWDAWLAQREALVRLEAATGVLTPTAALLQPLDPAAVRTRDSTTSPVRIMP